MYMYICIYNILQLNKTMKSPLVGFNFIFFFFEGGAQVRQGGCSKWKMTLI